MCSLIDEQVISSYLGITENFVCVSMTVVTTKLLDLCLQNVAHSFRFLGTKSQSSLLVAKVAEIISKL